MITYSENKEAQKTLRLVGSTPKADLFNWVARFQRNKFGVTRFLYAGVAALTLSSAVTGAMKGNGFGAGLTGTFTAVAAIAAYRSHRRYKFYRTLCDTLMQPEGYNRGLAYLRSKTDSSMTAPHNNQ